MQIQNTYVIARTARKRPTLMHVLSNERGAVTMCGLDISMWSRAYFNQPIPQVLCIRCTLHISHIEQGRGDTGPAMPTPGR